MNQSSRIAVKFGTFAMVMTLVTAALVVVFSQYRSGSANEYSAIFADVSDLARGDSVRVAGVQVGTVTSMTMQPDKTVLVDFDAEPDVVLTLGTRAAVRYLNLVGDRYLELLEGPGPIGTLPAGSTIPVNHTMPALDLDVLLDGLKPVVRGLSAQDVNALTGSLIQIVQGQGATIESLLSRTSSFTNALASNSQIVEDLIDSLNNAMAVVAEDGDKFGGAIDRLHRLIEELSADREPIGAAIESLSEGTASLVSLMGQARAPLAATVDHLNRLAPALDEKKDLIDGVLQRSPENYRKLSRMGAYGSFFNYYLCGVTLRVSDLQGRTAVFPWIKQDTGRCAEQP